MPVKKIEFCVCWHLTIVKIWHFVCSLEFSKKLKCYKIIFVESLMIIFLEREIVNF
jgi:hypothetical protein